MSNTEKRITAKMVLDDSGYSDTLKGINQELKNNKSALRAASTGLEAFGRSSESLNKVQESLNRQLELQNKKFNLYKSSIDKANEKLSSNINKRNSLIDSLDKEENKLDSLKRAYGANSSEVKESEEKIESLRSELNKTEKSIENNARKINSYETNLNKAQTEINRTTTDLNKLNKEFNEHESAISKSQRKYSKFGDEALSLGSKLTAGVTLPMAAAGMASFNLSSDLNENINKTNVVFKNNAQVILDWSKTSLDKMGMCRSSALDMASKFGDMGSSMGLSSQLTKDYSMNLTQLSADMASFKNISIDRANEALTGVYTGETEALKGLGIVMTQNNLEAYAESQGIKTKIKDMSQAEQVQLRYNYVMSVTKDAQGDFARTNDQAANATRTFFEATKELGATIGNDLLPALTPLINDVNSAIKSFAGMDKETRDMIIKTGLLAMSIGPVTSALGGVSKGVGGVIGAVKKVRMLKMASTGAEFTKILFGIGSAAEGVATATTGAGVAAGGFGGYKTYKYLNDSATPAVDLFADKAEYSSQKVSGAYGSMATTVKTGTIKISESTKKGVQAYLDMDKKASESLMDLRMNSDKFTKDTKNKVLKNFTDMSKKSSKLSKDQRNAMTVNFKKLVKDTGTLTKKNKDEIVKQYTAMVNGTKGLTKKQKEQTIKEFKETLKQSVGITKQQSDALKKQYTDMSNSIKQGLDKRRDDEIKSQKDFFGKSNALTTKEEADILKKTTDSWNNKKKNIDEMQKQIDNIIEKASKDHRQITNDEAKSIDEIQKKMKEQAVKTLSKNETEAKVILERMKGHEENITAEMASSKIKKLNESRDKAVQTANDECDKRLAEIIRMRDESKVISSEQADKLIADAKKQKDETIKAAEETRNGAVEKITNMNKEISDDVDTTTGDVKSNWDKFADWWDSWWPKPKTTTVTTNYVSNGQKPEGNWTGNSHFRGGLTYLHERGEELYDLPSGTRIYNHEMSENMVLETAKLTAENIANSMLKNNQGQTGDIIIPINIAGEKVEKVIVPMVSKKLAASGRSKR